MFRRLRLAGTLPSFRGQAVNDPGFDSESRTPDPRRLIEAYKQSAAALNMLRALTAGGYGALDQVHRWNQEFVANSPAGQNYEKIADQIDNCLRFMAACGISRRDPRLREVDFYTSHEGLLLNYEQALARPEAGGYYGSAHMLWIGARTNQLDGPHVEFMRGLKNPIGCKLGPETSPEEAVALCDRLNPGRIPGRLTLISRMGAKKVAQTLSPPLEEVAAAGHPVVWQCDPMHGNTYTSSNGRKTRRFDDIMAEIDGYFEAHQQSGTWPGGVHLEITGDAVTECVSGSEPDIRWTEVTYNSARCLYCPDGGLRPTIISLKRSEGRWRISSRKAVS